MQSSAVRTVSAFILVAAVELATERDVDVESILARHRIARSDLTARNAQLPADAVLGAWAALAQASADPDFGLHVAQRVRLETLDVLGCALRFSTDLRELLDKLLRFQRLVGDAWYTRVEAAREIVHARRVAVVAAADERHLVERAMAVFTLELRRLSERDIDPVTVCFRHGAPADLGLHRAIFRCPLRFGAPANEIAFHARALDHPVVNTDSDVEAVLDRYAEESLARLPVASDHVERVRRAVAEVLPDGPPKLAAVARRLRMSERTLQRRLAAEQTSLREVVDEVRRGLAARYLAGGAMRIDEVAFVLGFGDASSFNRAFRRWSALTPSEFRDGGPATRERSSGAPAR